MHPDHRIDSNLQNLCLRIRHPKVLLEEVSRLRTGKVLDIGCGSGVILKSMERFGMHVTGIDISEKAIAFCRKLAGWGSGHKFFKRDIREFPVVPISFDVIVAMSSIVAMRREEINNVFAKINRGLKPGGLLYLEVFTTRDPIWFENDKFMPEGENTYFHPRWGSFMYLFRPGELLQRFISGFQILEYKEVVVIDHYPYRHKHHEARLCARKNN